jgi:hypothetical protein
MSLSYFSTATCCSRTVLAHIYLTEQRGFTVMQAVLHGAAVRRDPARADGGLPLRLLAARYGADDGSSA